MSARCFVVSESLYTSPNCIVTLARVWLNANVGWANQLSNLLFYPEIWSRVPLDCTLLRPLQLLIKQWNDNNLLDCLCSYFRITALQHLSFPLWVKCWRKMAAVWIWSYIIWIFHQSVLHLVTSLSQNTPRPSLHYWHPVGRTVTVTNWMAQSIDLNHWPGLI